MFLGTPFSICFGGKVISDNHRLYWIPTLSLLTGFCCFASSAMELTLQRLHFFGGADLAGHPVCGRSVSAILPSDHWQLGSESDWRNWDCWMFQPKRSLVVPVTPEAKKNSISCIGAGIQMSYDELTHLVAVRNWFNDQTHVVESMRSPFFEDESDCRRVHHWLHS